MAVVHRTTVMYSAVSTMSPISFATEECLARISLVVWKIVLWNVRSIASLWTLIAFRRRVVF